MDYPELYLYIVRHMKIMSQGRPFISDEEVIKACKKVTFRAPKRVYRIVIQELVDMGVLREVHPSRYEIILNKKIKTRLSKLNDFIFPIH